MTAANKTLSYTAEGEWGHVAGVADIDGRPGAEIGLLGRSAASAQWGVFLTYRDGRLEPVSYVDGTPFELAVAGSIINRIGIECRSEGGAHQLVVTHLHLDPPSADSTIFIGGREVLAFNQDGFLTSSGEQQLRLTKDANGNDPPEAKIGGLNCKGFERFS